MSGKGDTRRPARISREEEDLRWRLALRQITRDEFDREYARLTEQGKTWRK